VIVRVLRNPGFISVDCGFLGETDKVDDTKEVSYLPDNGDFTDDAGTCYNISAEYVTQSMAKTWFNVRSFGAGAGVRNCYTLRSLNPGLKYIVRARFKYGNYDRLDSLPVFDLYIGVNYWKTVNISLPEEVLFVEAIVVVPDDFLQVCLVNTGAGTPFISGLDLRPLKRALYPQVTAEQGLALVTRVNFGTTNESLFLRYPDDPHDRIWFPMVDTETWSSASTTKEVQNVDLYATPSVVLQTAIMPRNVSQNLEFTWFSDPTPIDPSPGYIIILHFAELQVLGNQVRELNVTLNDDPWYTTGFTPSYLYEFVAYNNRPFQHTSYNLSVKATSNATLPPSINAAEIFTIFPTTNLGTESQDGMSCNNVSWRLIA
jgi:hypothetical protein